MLLVGLSGGLATGKSTVAGLFKACGAHVIDADRLARAVVEPGKPAWRDIVRMFGKEILREDRTLNRPALAKIVFGRRADLIRLNAIVHPRVAREQRRLVREIAGKDPQAVIVYDVPLLFEAGVHKQMDRTVVVAADRRTQIARLMARNGLTRADALRRIRAQMPLARKIRLADHVIDGSLPRARLRREVRRIFAKLAGRN
jgi:dephospho-CoA kinase